jgi:hypothetical protein
LGEWPGPQGCQIKNGHQGLKPLSQAPVAGAYLHYACYAS